MPIPKSYYSPCRPTTGGCSNLIDEALVRIEAGEYGECVHCGELVQERRLEAVPWARHCLRCQDLQERGLLNQEEE